MSKRVSYAPSAPCWACRCGYKPYMQVDQVSKDDFPLPTLGPILKEVQQEVIRGRGFALLRGLPVERWSRKETLVAYWGIGLHW